MTQKNISPLVSICCITYNHESYIHDAIKGFLQQKTNFPFEIIIHDDASTDKTPEIIRKYSDKYPDMIFPIFQTENQWSKGTKPSVKYVWPKARGEYIALCEGDDYWTDPKKLQKQIEILESNKEIGLVHTDYSVLFDKTGRFISSYYKNNKKEIAIGNSYESLLRSWGIKVATVCVRKDLLLSTTKSDVIKDIGHIFDLTLFIELAKYTKFAFINDVTAVYRVLENSESKYKDVDKFFVRAQRNFEIKAFFIKKYGASDYTRKIVLKEYLMRSFIFAFKNNKLPYLDDYYLKLKKENLSNYKTEIIYYTRKKKVLRKIVLVILRLYNQ